MANLKQEEQVVVFVTLWEMWHARRKAAHEHIFQSPLSLHYFVTSFIADQSKDKTHQPLTVAPRATTPAWIPPPAGWVKLNVDAAVGKNSGQGAVAAITHQQDGQFLGASILIFPGKSDA
jgi:hypothetical protein